MIKIKSDKIIVGETLFNGYLYATNGKISEISTQDKPCENAYDFTGKYVSAGFIDTHTHGAGGYPFMHCTEQDVLNACDFHFSRGMTTIVPTVSAADIHTMESAVEMISRAKKSGKAKGNIMGAHLEGPYLSAKQAGAQCPDFITPPVKADYERLVEKYGSDITRWTYAPENDENGAFCAYLKAHGIIASAGHTDAKYCDMQTAIEKGCNLITHLYSCTSTVTRDHGFRSLGVIESAFLRDELKDRSAFAGSVATADCLIKTLVLGCGVALPTAVKMLTKVPAEILGVNKGELKVGKDADIIVFNDDIQVSDIFIAGEKRM